MLRLPPIQSNLRQIFVAVVLVALNLSAGLTTSRHYPRAELHVSGTGGGYVTRMSLPDGSRVVYQGSGFGPFTDPHMIRPPRPTLLRVWSPVIASVATSVLILGAALSRHSLPPFSGRGQALVAFVILIAIWLASPEVRIAANSADDYHLHKCHGLGFHESVHANDLWSQYWRLLLRRPWPGDCICDIPPEESEPAPPWES